MLLTIGLIEYQESLFLRLAVLRYGVRKQIKK